MSFVIRMNQLVKRSIKLTVMKDWCVGHARYVVFVGSKFAGNFSIKQHESSHLNEVTVSFCPSSTI